MSYKKYFIEAIKLSYQNDPESIISEVENNFNIISNDTRFAATSSNPIDKRLDFSAYFLALIKTLDGRGESFEAIRKICLDIVLEYVRPKNSVMKFLRRLPARLTNTWLSNVVIRWFSKQAGQRSHEDGFVAKIITDKNETFGLGYGFDIVECGICKLFKKHNYSKYSSILCEVDEVTSGLAGLQLVRTGTIALGANKCDFRFKRK
jgi:hypothetical protein